MSRLFSVCKCLAKAIAKRLQSAARGTVSSRGGTGMAAIFGPGDQLFCCGQSGGTAFKGGLFMA